MKRALCSLIVGLAACRGHASKSAVGPKEEVRQERPGGGTDGAAAGGEGGGQGAGCRAAPGDPLAGSCERGKVLLDDGEPQAVGAIDKGALRKVVREHFEALRFCYEATPLANPNIAGTVVAKFTIQIDGSAHDVSASGVHPDVEACVADKVRGMKFPRPEGRAVEIAYPFTFKPS